MRETWDEVAELYGAGDSPFARIPQRLVELARIDPGERVVDVGCGNGLGLTALAATGVTAVTGVDFSRPMLEVARSVVGSSLVQADARALPLASGAVDVALASSVLQFVDGRSEALLEWRRILRPGGRLVCSVPRSGDDATRVLVAEVFRHLTPAAQQRLRAAPGPIDDLAGACVDAGFVDVVRHLDDFEVVLPDREAWWDLQWTHGFRRFLRELDPSMLDEVRDRAFELVAPQLAADGRYLGTQCFECCVATNPG